MNAEIRVIEAFSILGVQSQINKGSESPELFGRIWGQFESYGEIIESLSIKKHYFGIKFPTIREEVTEYLAGMMVAKDVSVPDGLMKRTVPGGNYAVFECTVEEIGECYLHIFTKWLPSAPEMFNPKNPVFEEYPEKNSTRPVSIYVPVNKFEKLD